MNLIQAILLVETRIEELTSMIHEIQSRASSNVLRKVEDTHNIRTYISLLETNQKVLKVLNGD